MHLYDSCMVVVDGSEFILYCSTTLLTVYLSRVLNRAPAQQRHPVPLGSTEDTTPQDNVRDLTMPYQFKRQHETAVLCRSGASPGPDGWRRHHVALGQPDAGRPTRAGPRCPPPSKVRHSAGGRGISSGRNTT